MTVDWPSCLDSIASRTIWTSLKRFPLPRLCLWNSGHTWEGTWQAVCISLPSDSLKKKMHVTKRWKPALFWRIGSWSRLPGVSRSPCKCLVFLSVRRPLWKAGGNGVWCSWFTKGSKVDRSPQVTLESRKQDTNHASLTTAWGWGGGCFSDTREEYIAFKGLLWSLCGFPDSSAGKQFACNAGDLC